VVEKWRPRSTQLSADAERRLDELFREQTSVPEDQSLFLVALREAGNGRSRFGSAEPLRITEPFILKARAIDEALDRIIGNRSGSIPDDTIESVEVDTSVKESSEPVVSHPFVKALSEDVPPQKEGWNWTDHRKRVYFAFRKTPYCQVVSALTGIGSQVVAHIAVDLKKAGFIRAFDRTSKGILYQIVPQIDSPSPRKPVRKPVRSVVTKTSTAVSKRVVVSTEELQEILRRVAPILREAVVDALRDVDQSVRSEMISVLQGETQE
jgi:hypothetical protein